MSEQSSNKRLKTIGFFILVFAVGIAGVLSGYLLRGRLPGTQERTVTMRAPVSLLANGMMFPDVVVAGENGNAMHTGEMIGADGCVVLFLDLECPPCEQMTHKWQAAVDSGAIFYHQLWGITFHSRADVDDYIAAYGVGFPIVVDSMRVFLSEYQVNRFPLEVIVGRSGKIRSASYDAQAPIDRRDLLELLAD